MHKQINAIVTGCSHQSQLYLKLNIFDSNQLTEFLQFFVVSGRSRICHMEFQPSHERHKPYILLTC